MSYRTLLAALLFAGGCVGSLEPAADDDGDDDVAGPDAGGTGPGGGNGQAKAMFDRDVFPILSAKCGAPCHGISGAVSTAFVATTVDTAYVTTVGYTSVVGNFTTANAPILTLVDPGPHNGRTYTADEKTKITAWMAEEVRAATAPTDPNMPPPTPGAESPAQATGRLISEWSGCLKATDFTELGFGEKWANKGSNQGNCEQCHVSGAYGFKASDDNLGMYETLSTNKYFMMAYFAVDLADPANAKIVPNYANFTRVGLRQVPHQEHPSFNTQLNDAAYVVLKDLYDRTMASKAAGTCGPARIPR